MTDRPIIFSAPMVRALLAGTKTQTRRKSGLADVNERPDAWTLHNVGPLGYMAKPSAKGKFGATFESREIEPGTLSICPQGLPYAPGDRLWVREAHSLHDAFGQDRDDGMRWGPWPGLPSAICPEHRRIAYFREGFDRSGPPRWRPSIHMPRWASRLTLSVTDVRVQRLQDISGRDVIAEGVRCGGCHDVGTGDYSACRDGGCFAGRNDFRDLWNSIHGPAAWDANPWVVAITFDVHRCNIDKMETQP